MMPNKLSFKSWNKIWHRCKDICRKHPKKALLGILCVPLLTIILNDQYISWAYHDAVYASIDAVPAHDVALVLGTSRIYDGHINRFYLGRIEAAAALYHAGKVRALVVSGDNSRDDYNEPELMKQDLIAYGVPEEHISCDFAGFSTLDSVHRIEKIFGQERYLIVSQDFHIRRALFIAGALDHQASAYAAPGPGSWFWLKVRCREVLARGKAFAEVCILQTGPRFLGPPIDPVLKQSLSSR